MSTRRLRISSKTNPGHSRESTPVQSQRSPPVQSQQSEREHTPGQSAMSSRRLPVSSSPNSGNSAENTPVQSQRSTQMQSQRLEREHTPRQSVPSTPNISSTSANESWKVGSMHNDGRLRIEVIGGLLEPSGKCSRGITDSICERLEPTGFCWKEVSKLTKDFYFEEFKKSFVWRHEDKVIYKAWVKKASRRYSNFCSEARKKWENGEVDNRVGTHVWLRWAEHWETPDFQAKSTTQKRNRSGGTDHYPPTHTGGSASLRAHAALLAEANDEEPTPAYVYELTHTVNNDRKTFITKKAERVHKRIEELRAQRSQPIEGSSEPQPVDEDQLFFDAVGGLDKKNRIYGMGSLQSIIYGTSGNNTTSRYSSSSFNNEEYYQMQVELREMKELQEMRERESQEMKDQVRELQEMRERESQEMILMRDQMNEMKNQLAMVLNAQNRS